MAGGVPFSKTKLIFIQNSLSCQKTIQSRVEERYDCISITHNHLPKFVRPFVKRGVRVSGGVLTFNFLTGNARGPA